MNRRTFVGSAFAGLSIAGAFVRPAKAKPGDIPYVVFDRTGEKLSLLGQGGAKLAYLRNREAARQHVLYAYGLGVNYFDCARSYWGGLSEQVYGDVLPPFRKNIFLTTKSLKRKRKDAEAELRESLRAMKTDHVDLWQIHNVRSDGEIEQILGPGGAYEAFEAAKKAGLCRFIGFSAHYDPEIGLRMLESGVVFDTVLMPLHAADPSYLSFERRLLPAAVRKGVAIQAMKVFGSAGLLRSLHVEECLGYSLSLPIHAAVVGCSTAGHWEDNARAVRKRKRLSDEEMENLRKRATEGAATISGAPLEYWKRQPSGVQPGQSGSAATIGADSGQCLLPLVLGQCNYET